MKKISFLILTILAVMMPYTVSASTMVSERTEDNLQIWENIEVTNSNIDNILNTPKVNENEKIYDFADLFTDIEEDELFEKVSDYINEHDMDMVIVKINDNNKYNAKEYAEDFYDYNYFGKGDTYDGILFLIDMDTREIYVNTTGEAMLYYDDARIEGLLDAAYVYMTSAEYYQATRAFITRALNYANQGYSSSADDYYIDENGDLKEKKKINWFITLGGSIAISSIVVYIFISKHKGIKIATEADNYLDIPGIQYGTTVDNFLTTYTSRTYIGSSSSSGGRSGGGISSSRGSSGRSHGGGGRRF